MSNPVLVAGAGIGGLTLALALLRAGKDVVVLERAAEAREVGAGISLGASASRGLYSLGLRDKLAALADTPAPSTALDHATGKPLAGAFSRSDHDREELADAYMIHRADFHELLLSEVEDLSPGTVKFGSEMLDFEQSGDGVTVKLHDGSELAGSALVGCDGLRSRTRSLLFGDGEPKFTGWVAYRFLVPYEKVSHHMSAGPNATYVGPGLTLLRYALRGQELVNCVAFSRTSDWQSEGWNNRISKSELIRIFEGWHEDVIALAANAPVEGTAKWALFDREPADIWTRGRVTLLGDAAHPILPFLGMGAALAIEDAIVLGRLFAERSAIPEIFDRYQDLRRDRARTIQIDSRIQGEILSLGERAPHRVSQTYAERMRYDPASVDLSAAR